MSSKSPNLAELLSIDIDKDILHSEWENFVKEHINNINWDFRIFVDIDMFHGYLRQLLESISDIINEQPKYLMLQISDKRLYPHKKFLNIIHKDVDRQSCITLPLIYNLMEPVLFYDDIPGLSPEEHRKTGLPWPEQPTQVGRYSGKHPTLVNVQNLHNVRVLDETSPRVLLQLSFDSTFHDIVDRNPSIWRIF